MKDKTVLMIGADLSSNGGIASVVKSYYTAYQKESCNIKLYLLKTNHYKDKGLIFELLIFLSAFFRAIYIVLIKRIDILHIHSSASISFYRKSFFVIIGKLFDRKVILHLHSSNFYEFFLSDRWIIRTVFKMTNKVIVLCKDWENRLTVKYPNLDVLKVENPFESHQFSNPMEKESNQQKYFKILFVGFFIESKGIKDLIEISKLLKSNKISDIKIQIAGKGELESYIKDSIEKYNLNEIVDIIGWVGGEKKERAFIESDAFILPSYKEGMPISILEAMSYGLPIISTNIAGIPDIVENSVNGYLNNPGDIIGFLNSIELLKDNLNVQKHMRRNNILRSKLNSGDIIFSQIVELYNKL